MQNGSSYEWIHPDELQHLQEEFCRVTGLCAYCLDADLEKVTKVSGTPEQIEKLQEYEADGRLAEVLERVEEGSLEDQAVETLGESGEHVAAVAVRVEGKTMLYWLLFVVVSEGDEEMMRLLHILDLLRDTSASLFRNMLSCFSAEAESRRSRFAEQEMEQNLHTI